MKIAIANDHAAVEMKNQVIKHLEEAGHTIVNFGIDVVESCDYPVYAKKAADAVVSGDCELGILICGTGVGMSLAANKIKGVRAVCCSEPYSARMSRAHNNANIVCFGARVIGIATAFDIVDNFISTAFEGERHAKRVNMIIDLDERR